MNEYKLYINGQWTETVSGEVKDDINPADGSVVVTCGDGSGEGSVTVRDLLGKVVKQGRMYEGMCRIDLSDLPDGIYYLTLTSQLGTATRKLLVR